MSVVLLPRLSSTISRAFPLPASRHCVGFHFYDAFIHSCPLVGMCAAHRARTNPLPAFDIRGFSFSFAETAHIILIPFSPLVFPVALRNHVA